MPQTHQTVTESPDTAVHADSQSADIPSNHVRSSPSTPALELSAPVSRQLSHSESQLQLESQLQSAKPMSPSCSSSQLIPSASSLSQRASLSQPLSKDTRLSRRPRLFADDEPIGYSDLVPEVTAQSGYHGAGEATQSGHGEATQSGHGVAMQDGHQVLKFCDIQFCAIY